MIRLHDTVTLTLDISHSLNVELVPLEFGETLGDFAISAVVNRPPRVVEQREIHQIELLLTPRSAGSQRLGAIPIRVKPLSPESSGDSASLLLPARDVDVSSTTAKTASPESLNRPAGPVPVPDHGLYSWGIVAIVLLASLFFLVLRFRRKPKTIQITEQPTPTQIAMRKLATLLDQRLHERDVKQFYIEITAIVRWFIEQKTEIRAPELTTEEFLKEISRQAEQKTVHTPPPKTVTTSPARTSTGSSNLITLATATGRFKAQQAAETQKTKSPVEPLEPVDVPDEKTSGEWSDFFSEKNRLALAEFLKIADLVKFARFQPTRDDVMLGFRRASEFVELGHRLGDPDEEENERPKTVTLHENAQKTGTHRRD